MLRVLTTVVQSSRDIIKASVVASKKSIVTCALYQGGERQRGSEAESGSMRQNVIVVNSIRSRIKNDLLHILDRMSYSEEQSVLSIRLVRSWSTPLGLIMMCEFHSFIHGNGLAVVISVLTPWPHALLIDVSSALL